MSHVSHAPGPSACHHHRRPPSEPFVVVPGARVCPGVPRLPVTSVDGRPPDRTGNVALADVARLVPRAVAGNLASLTESGNPADSGISVNAVRQAVAEAGTAYQKPEDGVPKTDLSEGVQTSLGKADAAVQPDDIMSGGKVKSDLLPSYVDDVVEFDYKSFPTSGIPAFSDAVAYQIGDKVTYGSPSRIYIFTAAHAAGVWTEEDVRLATEFPADGESGKIYVTLDTNKTYRWSGSEYIEISNPDLDNTMTRTSANGVKSSGIWSAIWGALVTAPAASVHAWVTSLVSTLSDSISTLNDTKASKADATLNERGLSAWAWEGTPPIYDGKEVVLRLEDYELGPDDNRRYWVAYTVDGEQCSLIGDPATRDDDNTKTTVTVEIDGGSGAHTATRTALQGYRLGPDDPSNPNRDKPLASEAEAEALRTAIAGKEDTSNKVTSISDQSTDTQYPSAKCVYDALQGVDTKVKELYNADKNVKCDGEGQVFKAGQTGNYWTSGSNTWNFTSKDTTASGTFYVYGTGLGALSYNPATGLLTNSYGQTKCQCGVGLDPLAGDDISPTDGSTGYTFTKLTNTWPSNPTDLFARVSDLAAFSTTKSYAVGDIAGYDGKVYKCTAAHTGAWDASHFTLATKAEAQAYLAGLADKADDNAVVKLTGDQTVAGSKTFTSGVIVNNASGFSTVDPSNSSMVQFKQSGIEVYPADSSSYVLQYPAVAGVIALLQNIAPTWVDSEGIVYQTDSLWAYNGVLYRCKLGYTYDYQAVPPSDTTHWETATVEKILAILRGKFADYLPLAGGKAITGNVSMDGVLEFTSTGRAIIQDGMIVISNDHGATGTSFYIQGIRTPNHNAPLLFPNYANGDYFATYLQIGIPAFDATATYALNAKVVYDNAVWNCTTAVATAGAWTGTTNWTKLFGIAVDSTPTANSDNLMTSGAIKTALDAADPTNKLNSTAAAPDFSSTATYDVGNRVTYLGVLYECVVAKTTASATTPDNDIYDSTHTTNHWKVTDMTTPDATVDITADNKLRVVGADGTLLWQQGYDLKSASSNTLSDGAEMPYEFAANASDAVTLTLPSVVSGKVGDFLIDVTNPALDSTATGYPSTFSDSATYAVGDKVVYDSKIWRCTTAVSTAGAWTGSTNWEEAWPYFTIAGLDSTLSVAVPKGENLTDILSFAPGTMCELLFTLSAFKINSRPTWVVARKDVENGGAST